MPGYYLAHYGVSVDDGAPQGSGRYPKGSGDRPYQHDEAKRLKAEKRKETLKKVGSFAYKAAWTGIAVALKVVASSAITSMTLAGVAAAGFQFIQSPACQQMMNRIGVAAGNILYRDFVEPAATSAASNIDNLIGMGLNAIGEVDPGTPDLSKITAGTKYLSKLGSSSIGGIAMSDVLSSPAAKTAVQYGPEIKKALMR